MIPIITDKDDWWAINGSEGLIYLPTDGFSLEEARENYHGEVWSIERVTGYGAALTAPGYLDRTDWAVFGTVKDAADYLLNTYYDAPDDELTSEDIEARRGLETFIHGRD